ncbi:hypothetical protein R83H12_01927 [Fibrobacteria bacterium R8-3-H12]
MYCKECGYQIMEGWKFCEGCGRPLENAQETIPESETKTEVKEAVPVAERNDDGSVIKFLGLFGLLAVIFLYALFGDDIKFFTVKEAKISESLKETKTLQKIARIKYEITGTASSVNITLTNPNGMEQYSNVKPNIGSYEFSVPITRNSFDYFHASIMAQNSGSRGNITVTIYVNGKKFRTATSSGAYVIAEADGLVTYEDIE